MFTLALPSVSSQHLLQGTFPHSSQSNTYCCHGFIFEQREALPAVNYNSDQEKTRKLMVDTAF